GDTDDAVASIAVDGQGAAYVGGSFFGAVDFDPGPGDATRSQPKGGVYVVKLSSGGAFLWVQTIPGAGINGLAVAPDGGAIVLGSVPQSFSTIVTKVGPDPVTSWTLAFGADSNTYAPSIVVGASGFVIGGIAYAD